ncbi:S8 family serine peptidase [Roseofilum sp. BLCC_M154]|uniref:S8 family serine peptidase n=1 Tax=Roseofilum acuticapitatum BLCC-M154 TaxID=3022444 RepID=A0ABT7AVF7_9CYAN|nr:S8 family serine peptidase [Roseofilum acuticapitatum]MDJ1170898.1 S8 family serine peptidase [Roseofilum acuticapitatum BLCC-M154]
MYRQSSTELPPKVYAEAVVVAATGESLLSSPTLVTSKNVAQFDADPRLLEETENRLRKAKFEVLSVGRSSISIAGPPELYEREFNTRLIARERLVNKGFSDCAMGTYLDSLDNKPKGEIDTSKTTWANEVAGIAINEPIYYAIRPNIPAAFPPFIDRSRHLYAPKDIAKGLNGDRLHQLGITGRGVKVVMVDSGWYEHPFFRRNGYRGKVVLAPGSSEPKKDDHGHGTGESANLFAIAPEVDFTMVKADVALYKRPSRNLNSIAALREAIALKPDIISCSWGSDQRRSILSPYNKVLASLVAEAINQGIIVIFAAGNGHWGFPAQHPEVIAAGGVYMPLDESHRHELEASSYSSGFISPVYRDRTVPDVCGLVGHLPHGQYLMLPIPPGCQTDDQYAQRGDGTTANDGWAAFSGTSAAAPQLAGICALMKQIDPSLSPERIANILEDTATDVTLESKAYPRHQVAIGHDIHTGHGLANAWEAIQAIQPNVTENPPPISTPASTPPVITQEVGLQPSSVTLFSSPSEPTVSPTVLSKRKLKMSADYPKLREKLDEIRNEFDAIIKRKIDAGEIEEVQLSLSEHHFSSRSPRTDGLLALVACVKEVDPDEESKTVVDDIHQVITQTLKAKGLMTEDLEKRLSDNADFKNGLENILEARKAKPEIGKKHIYAAKSLLKVREYQKLATRVLIAGMNSPKSDISEEAAKALGEFSEENSRFALPTSHGRNLNSVFDVRAKLQDRIKKCRYVKENNDGYHIVQDDTSYYECKDECQDRKGQFYCDCHPV